MSSLLARLTFRDVLPGGALPPRPPEPPGRCDRQAGGGDRLAVPLLRLVRSAQADPLGERRELVLQHARRGLDDAVAALAGSDAAQHEHALDRVEVGEVRDAVAEVDPDRLVDLARPRVALGHQPLHLDQALGERHLGGKRDPRRRQQPAHRLLREVLRADARVARPLVDRGALAVVDRHEGELVEPGRDVAVGRDVAGRRAGAERDAEHGVRAQRHRARERRHLAVVHHLERHAAPPLLQRAEQAADVQVEVRLGDAAVERADARLAVDVDAGGAAADRVDPRQVGARRGGSSR